MSEQVSGHAGLEEALTGPAALPRRNGELVFEAPWQSRAFGLVVGLHRAGVFEWGEFRERLIDRIGAWDATHDAGEPYQYYEHWLGAVEDVLVAKGLADAPALDARTAEIASRPAGHDHHHDHDHPHEH